MRSLSKSINGKLPGVEPVAIIVFFASMVCASSPVILICVASSNEPKPRNTVILFLSIKKSIPLIVVETTSRLRAIICGKLTSMAPATSMPCVLKSLVAVS